MTCTRLSNAAARAMSGLRVRRVQRAPIRSKKVGSREVSASLVRRGNFQGLGHRPANRVQPVLSAHSCSFLKQSFIRAVKHSAEQALAARCFTLPVKQYASNTSLPCSNVICSVKQYASVSTQQPTTHLLKNQAVPYLVSATFNDAASYGAVTFLRADRI